MTGPGANDIVACRYCQTRDERWLMSACKICGCGLCDDHYHHAVGIGTVCRDCLDIGRDLLPELVSNLGKYTERKEQLAAEWKERVKAN